MPLTCHLLSPSPCRASDFPEFLYVDFVVENGTGAPASTRPVTWQVEYPGQDPEAEKDKMVWEIQVSERDVRALVPLVKVRPELLASFHPGKFLGLLYGSLIKCFLFRNKRL